MTARDRIRWSYRRSRSKHVLERSEGSAVRANGNGRCQHLPYKAQVNVTSSRSSGSANSQVLDESLSAHSRDFARVRTNTYSRPSEVRVCESASFVNERGFPPLEIRVWACRLRPQVQEN